MKRIIDIVISLSVLLLTSPFLLLLMLLVWLQDEHSPFYVAPRVGRGGKDFNMIKLRSMVVNADKTGVTSTAARDRRITALGSFIRKYKFDELMQLWNVLVGDMSLVGPRPNTRVWGVDLYTRDEKRLLDVRPGITDYSSIIFSDEGDILADKADPDIAYNQLIRPWKSRLGIFYVDHHNFVVDIKLIWFTAQAIVSRPRALKAASDLLVSQGAPAELVAISRREAELVPMPPPGSSEIVTRAKSELSESRGIPKGRRV